MRIKNFILLLLTIPIFFTWLLTNYILFPSKLSTHLESPKMKLFINRLKQFENDVQYEIEVNQNSLKELESEFDLKLDNLYKAEKLTNRDEKLKSLKNTYAHGPVIPVLVFACNRVSVTRCLDQLIRYRTNVNKFPIIVSQDCNDPQTKSAILDYGDKVSLIEQPDQSDIIVPPKEKKFRGYFKIARHYGWALNQTFFKYKFDSVIIVEDDLDIAPDFFEYFSATYDLLKNDPSLWCISAWNDNGKSNLVDVNNGQTKLYRTDFFPGLGWMLTQQLWQELASKWPKSYWDDWIRQPEQRKDRACIRPELSRTKTFGKFGVSNGLFYEKHLKYIHLNEKIVPFSKMDLSYLLKKNYDKQFMKEVYEDSQEIGFVDYKLNPAIISPYNSIRFKYKKETFKKIARSFGLMDDFRSGVPRTGYKGVITFYLNGKTAYLVPEEWHGYDLTWS